jgi:hypothetical protein
MESDKYFNIHQGQAATTVNTSLPLGLILRRPEVREIVSSFGSSIIGHPDASMEIIPPIAQGSLSKLGEELVRLANELDPSKPLPTYHIN